jgi:hypothetical protein
MSYPVEVSHDRAPGYPIIGCDPDTDQAFVLGVDEPGKISCSLAPTVTAAMNYRACSSGARFPSPQESLQL